MEVRKPQDADQRRQVETLKKPRRIYKHSSKRVGFTKVRMEDCLRCDACSCIYIDKEDYFKHIKNFHQKYKTTFPRMRSNNSACCDSDENVAAVSCLAPEALSEKYIIEKIKERWQKVSKKLKTDEIYVKEEPCEEPGDMSHYLSQVEVKIKVET